MHVALAHVGRCCRAVVELVPSSLACIAFIGLHAMKHLCRFLHQKSLKLPPRVLPRGILLNLGSNIVFACCYDITIHKPREGSTFLPPYDARLGGRRRGMHGLGFWWKGDSGASRSLENMHVALEHVGRYCKGMVEALPSSLACTAFTAGMR
jgi:hypothetical protein